MNLRAASRNPFRNAVAADPWQSPEADVITIHDQAFRHCCRALDEVRLQGRTSSVLIYGEAGSGKTHLLSRLRAHIVRPDATDQAIFIAVTLQTSPQMIWRYLRRRLVDDLLRRTSNDLSQFERILLHRLAESHPREADVMALLQRLRDEARHHNNVVSELSELFDHVAAQSEVSFDLSLRAVICHLLLRRHVSEARAWLRGESLHESALTAWRSESLIPKTAPRIRPATFCCRCAAWPGSSFHSSSASIRSKPCRSISRITTDSSPSGR